MQNEMAGGRELSNITPESSAFNQELLQHVQTASQNFATIDFNKNGLLTEEELSHIQLSPSASLELKKSSRFLSDNFDVVAASANYDESPIAGFGGRAYYSIFAETTRGYGISQCDLRSLEICSDRHLLDLYKNDAANAELYSSGFAWKVAGLALAGGAVAAAMIGQVRAASLMGVGAAYCGFESVKRYSFPEENPDSTIPQIDRIVETKYRYLYKNLKF
ncbi:MAG: hypothetical protein K2Z81_04535 [Cyanobacteria bacterium]|nr:hypothetical protein [Cyanobacteriota bacterium]